jgi:hypothetical protein
LEHTGKFDGIADGLNAYEKRELLGNAIEGIVSFFYYLFVWVKSIFKR